MVVRLKEQVCNRINMNVGAALPKVGEAMDALSKLKAAYEQKCLDDAEYNKETEEFGSNTTDIVKNLKFALNTLTAEVGLMQKTFNNDRIKQMNE